MNRIDIDCSQQFRIGWRRDGDSTWMHARALRFSLVGGEFYLTNPTNPTILLEMPMNPDVFHVVRWSGRCPEPDQATENPTNSIFQSKALVITNGVAR